MHVNGTPNPTGKQASGQYPESINAPATARDKQAERTRSHRAALFTRIRKALVDAIADGRRHHATMWARLIAQHDGSSRRSNPQVERGVQRG